MQNRILPRVLRVLGAGVVCWLVAGNPLCKAQLMTTGAMNGTVVDQSGAAVPEAKVTITNVGTRTATQTVSNGDGSFSQVGLAVGNYEVTVTEAGFSSFTETSIYVGPASVRTVNAVLKPSTVVTTVNVEASAAQVQTSTSDISSQVEEQQVGTLPLNGRSYQGLAALMPGVVDLAAGSSLGSGGFNTFNTMSLNGKGQGGTLYTVDGIWNMNTGWMRQTTITPNPDAIQEVRVLQNNYSPEYNLMEANVVIVQTKSGTQTFRGDAWEYLRNTALSARNFFSPPPRFCNGTFLAGTSAGLFTSRTISTQANRRCSSISTSSGSKRMQRQLWLAPHRLRTCATVFSPPRLRTPSLGSRFRNLRRDPVRSLRL
jgi:hypothetical protein